MFCVELRREIIKYSGAIGAQLNNPGYLVAMQFLQHLCRYWRRRGGFRYCARRCAGCDERSLPFVGSGVAIVA
jgi:hypothetical protein